MPISLAIRPKISRSGLVPMVFERALQLLNFAGDVGDRAVLLVGGRRGEDDVGALAPSRSGTSPGPRRTRSAMRAGAAPADSRRRPRAHRDRAQSSISGKCQAGDRRRRDSRGRDRAAGPCPTRRASSSNPPGRRTSPECRANRRMRPAADRVALDGVAEQDDEFAAQPPVRRASASSFVQLARQARRCASACAYLRSRTGPSVTV